MPKLRMEQTQSVQMRQEAKQILQIEQATLLEMQEDDFARLITEIEQSPLFKRLYQREKLIHYQRLPRTDVPASFYVLKEEILASTGSFDVESLLSDRGQIVGKIQKLGVENFRKYFLFPESGMTPEEIARNCDLNVTEVQEINSLIDQFSIMSEFYHPSNIASDGVHYSKIASVEKDGDGFIISYYSPRLARGRYSIDYQRFEELASDGEFTATDAKEARQLFKRLEMVNSRKDTVSQILHKIIDKQALYLESANPRSLLPFSQKELASSIGLAPSSVSRAIRGRSIDTPWGVEMPLKHFFPRPKQFRRELLRQLLETEDGLSTDEAIRASLWQKFGVAVSRRSVANLRKELKIPAMVRRATLSGCKEKE